MKLVFTLLLLLTLGLQAEETIECDERMVEMLEALEFNDKNRALVIADVIINECIDIEAIDFVLDVREELNN